MLVRARTSINRDLLKNLIGCMQPQPEVLMSTSYFFNSGCDSLRFILRLMGPGKKVAIQVFTCSTVLDAINCEKDEAVFLDVNPDFYTTTYEIVEKRIQDIDILVLTHLFGIPNPDYIKIKQLCSEYNVVLIDDLCQTYHGKVGGYYLEELSDIYFYSFFYDKPISSVLGGMLRINKLLPFSQNAHDKYLALPQVDDKKGRNNLKVLFLMHQLLSPALYQREFRTGTLWKIILMHWPLKWRIQSLNVILNSLFIRILVRFFNKKTHQCPDVKRLSNIEISYIRKMMEDYKCNNKTLIDFYIRNKIEMPKYLLDERIECSIAKRAIVKVNVQSDEVQVGLYNWPELICAKEDYGLYPGAVSVIMNHSNIPTWTDQINHCTLKFE